MKSRILQFSICAAALSLPFAILLCGTQVALGDTLRYELTGPVESNLIHVGTFVDGVQTGSTYSYPFDTRDSTILLDVDPDTYRTRFWSLYGSSSMDSPGNGTVAMPGFDPDNLPFTIQASLSWVCGPSDWTSIDPITMDFDNPGFGGSWTFTGGASVDGQLQGFALFPPFSMTQTAYVDHHLQTEGFPQQLTLDVAWSNHDSTIRLGDPAYPAPWYTIYSGTFNGYQVDLKVKVDANGVNPGDFVFLTGGYGGEVIPEPVTLTLLAIGGLGLLRGRRRFGA